MRYVNIYFYWSHLDQVVETGLCHLNVAGFRRAGLCRVKAGHFRHLRDQILLGNHQLFLRHVTRYVNDFHPVSEGFWYCVKDIGSADEEDFGEVDRDVQVVVKESPILFRVNRIGHQLNSTLFAVL